MQIVLLVIVLSFYSDTVGVVVRIPTGLVRGIVEETRNGSEYLSFRGIRYSTSPVGKNRFKPVKPVEPWDGEYDATKDGPICPQSLGNPEIQSEDCLVINIFTKNLSTSKPIMVYIHGGSFISLSGHSVLSVGPQYLMERDIVLVSFNYRLGILGFIATNSPAVPRNLGFKDQVMALRWVQENIRYFGGNPDKVTIFGQSAGGIAVSLHLLSPLSTNLFHRAIIMSGSPTTRINSPNIKQTEIISKSVGCTYAISSDVIECLKNVTFRELVKASDRLNEFEKNPIRKWNYLVESKVQGQERFLENDPAYLISHGIFNKVPIMIGVTSTEFALWAHNIVQNATLLEKFNTEFEKIAPVCFLYETDTVQSYRISQKLKEIYFDNKPVSNSNFDDLATLFGDAIIRSGVQRFVDILRSHADVYYYTNSYTGRYSRFYYPEKKPYGMEHADDLFYLFTSNGSAPVFHSEDPENFMVERLTRIMATFANAGYPIDESDPVISNLVWQPSNRTTENLFEISGSSRWSFMRRLSYWDNFFPYFKIKV